MSPELEQKLYDNYPKIFPLETRARFWDLSCGDGWYPLIDRLCANIQSQVEYSRRMRAYDLRYNRALSRAIRTNDPAPLMKFVTFVMEDQRENRCRQLLATGAFKSVPRDIAQVVALQIKEKFGTLCFYYTGGDERISAMVSFAESVSSVICEVCGAPGECKTTRGWVTTLCETHRNERENRTRQ